MQSGLSGKGCGPQNDSSDHSKSFKQSHDMETIVIRLSNVISRNNDSKEANKARRNLNSESLIKKEARQSRSVQTRGKRKAIHGNRDSLPEDF